MDPSHKKLFDMAGIDDAFTYSFDPRAYLWSTRGVDREKKEVEISTCDRDRAHMLDAMTYAVEAFSDKINPKTTAPTPERDRGTLRDPYACSMRRNFCREALEKFEKEHPPPPGGYGAEMMRDMIKQAIKAKKEESKMQLFEFAAFYTATEKGEKSQVIVQPTTVVAKTQEQARTLAARAIPEDYTDRLEKVTIVVRPFE